MIAYLFRFPVDENIQWIGLAVARDKHEMFWQIDVHGDPYSALIATVKSGVSFCVKATEDRYVDEPTGEEQIDADYEDVELSDDLMMWEYVKWRKPDWSGVHPTEVEKA